MYIWIYQFVNISNLASILLRQMGHSCPNSMILSLQKPQKLACLHGIKSHVSALRDGHTVHTFSMSVFWSASSSESSDSLDRQSSCALMQPIVWLIAWRNSHGVNSPSGNSMTSQPVISPPSNDLFESWCVVS